MTQQTRPDPDSSRPAAPAAHRDDELDGVVTRHGLAGETLGESLLRVHTAETGALADEFLALHLAPRWRRHSCPSRWTGAAASTHG